MFSWNQLLRVTTASIILAVAGNCAALAMGPGGTSGGDEVGLEFVGAFDAAMADLRIEQPATYAKLTRANLQKLSGEAHILVVDKELPVSSEGVHQQSVAVNVPSRNLILINRSRWSKIKDVYAKRGLALHEFASLKRMESTGRYPYSAAYISNHGISASALSASSELDGLNSSLSSVAKVMRGVWTGAAISETDGKSYVGAIGLGISTKFVTSPEGKTLTMIETTIDYLAKVRSTMSASNTYYDPKTGVFQSQLLISRVVNGKFVDSKVSINGVLNDAKGMLNGTIETEGSPGYGARIHLVRGGPNLDKIAASNALPGQELITTNYAGAIEFRNSVDGPVVKSAVLTIRELPTDAGNELLNNLSPTHELCANLNFGDDAQLMFANSVLDTRSGILTGTAELKTGGHGVEGLEISLSLDCAVASEDHGMDCMITASNLSSAKGHLIPNIGGSSEPANGGLTPTAIVRRYEGSAKLNKIDPSDLTDSKMVNKAVILTVILPPMSSMQEVQELLIPSQEKYAQTSFSLKGGFGESFPNSKWDKPNMTLTASETFSTPSGISGNSYLNCTNFSLQDPAKEKYNFSCTFSSSLVSSAVPMSFHN